MRRQKLANQVAGVHPEWGRPCSSRVSPMHTFWRELKLSAFFGKWVVFHFYVPCRPQLCQLDLLSNKLSKNLVT